MNFFSVIIPTYNRAAFIRETVDSVLAQLFRDFEVIIVDDGSKDNTEELIQDCFGQNGKVRYYKKENGERGAARNYGLEKATGEFAVFFDSDDLMKENYLHTLHEVISGNKEVVFLAVKYNFIDETGKEKPAPVQRVKEGWYDRRYFLEGNILACNYCIRIREHQYRPFPPERELASMEDWLFILANTETHKVFIKDRVCLSMRQHDERSMENNQKVIEARRKATEWVLRNIRLSPGEMDVLRGWSHYFCGIHQYLDHNRAKAVGEALKAMKKAGVNKKFIWLLVKSVIGRKIIQRLR